MQGAATGTVFEVQQGEAFQGTVLYSRPSRVAVCVGYWLGEAKDQD